MFVYASSSSAWIAERKKALMQRWGGYWRAWSSGDSKPDLLLVKA
jgi:hypothetical protein